MILQGAFMNKRTVIFTAVLVLICFLLLGYTLFMTVFAAVMWHMEDDPVGITVKVIGCLMGVLAALYLIAALAGLSKGLAATNVPTEVSAEEK